MNRAIVVALCLSFAAPAFSDESVRDEAERWIEMKMRAAIERPPRLRVRAVDEAPPAWLVDAPAELVDAWRSYRTLEVALQKRIPTAPPGPPVRINQFNLDDTNSPVRRFLRGERVDLVREASRLQWNNFCATGIEPFLNDSARMVLMGLLETGDHAAAAAAVVSHDARRWRTKESDLVPRYLQALGLDWEQLYLGALMSSYDPGPVIESRDFQRRLVERGSVRAARSLLVLSRLPPFNTPAELSVLGEFVEPGPLRSTALVDVSGYWRAKPLYLDPSEQTEILARLAAFVTAQTGHRDLERVVGRLAELRREEGRSALRRALELQSAHARTAAAFGLESMGEAMETVAPLPPVPFRIVVDGQPLAGRAVTFEIWWTNQDKSTTSTSVHATTDADGRALVPRSDLVDPARQKPGAGLRIRFVPSSPDDPCFQVEQPLAAATAGREVAVDVVTHPLVLHLRRPESAEPFGGEVMTVGLSGPSRGGYCSFKLPAAERIVLGRIQAGTIQVYVKVAGAGEWSGEVALGAPREVEVVLAGQGSRPLD